MKNKTYLCAITLVIAGLLITSTTGALFAQKTSAKEKIENNEIGEVSRVLELQKQLNTEYKLVDGFEITDVPSSIQLQKPGQMNAEKQTMAAIPSQTMESASMERPHAGDRATVTLWALHPGLGAEPHIDGYTENAVLGYRYFYEDTGQGIVDGPAVAYEATNDNFQTSCAGLYFVDDMGNPLDLEYPSVHFRGYLNGSTDPDDTMFSGTCVDQYYGTNGGATYILRVDGDPCLNTSYGLWYWDWSTYGWYDAKMAEHAEIYYSPDMEWQWGFNSHVMSTTYWVPEIEYTNYQTDGCFINYQTDETGYGTISWYSHVGNATSTDSDLDDNSNLYVDYGPGSPYDDYAPVQYAGYAAYDPSTYIDNVTNNFLAIREFDFKEEIVNDSTNAFDVMWSWEPDEVYSMVHPAIAAANGNVIVMVELRNTTGSDYEVAILQTNNGEVGNLTYVGSILQAENADVQHVECDTFIAHVTAVNDTGSEELFTYVTYNGGVNWTGPYQWSGDEDNIIEYRCHDISDDGRVSIWEWDNSSGLDTYFVLMYTFNTFLLEGDVEYPEGDPVDPVDIRISNVDNFFRRPPCTITGNHYRSQLIKIFDVLPDDNFRLYAKDNADYKGVTDQLYPDIRYRENFTHTIDITVQCIPGDLDFDGDVDLSDLAKLLSVYGCSTPDPCYEDDNQAFECDIDWDGDVDLSDLAALLANYGYSP